MVSQGSWSLYDVPRAVQMGQGTAVTSSWVDCPVCPRMHAGVRDQLGISALVFNAVNSQGREFLCSTGSESEEMNRQTRVGGKWNEQVDRTRVGVRYNEKTDNRGRWNEKADRSAVRGR